jgi:hypothetical protein
MIEPDRVEKIFIDCLFTADELPQENPTKEDLPADAVIAEGISTFALHPGRLESHRDEVKDMLDQLPVLFRATAEGGGGGWSFLNACMVRERERPELWKVEEMEQWTGLQVRMDQLFALGQALGYVKSQFPRSMWGSLPGGVPYYVVTLGVHV